ncbi:unnamed protein product [Rotaria sp. Silwood2]|nr:unnamed protein product [Rotaria sp. Silwood2]CAF4618129.1 unnamed protein product [Rotaria sp. Silwood2]
MAVGIHSINQNVSSNSTNRTVLRLQRRVKPDLCRLATFRQWKTNTQSNVSPAVLAKVGFSYTGKGDKVRCDACGLEIDNWKTGMDPKQEHMKRRPECQFVLDQHEIFSKNGILSLFCLSTNLQCSKSNDHIAYNSTIDQI